MFGLTLAPITDADRETYSIGAEIEGVLVSAVEPGSEAAEKSVEAGHVIVQVSQQDVEAPEDVVARIDALKSEGRRTVMFLIADADRQDALRFAAFQRRPLAATGGFGIGPQHELLAPEALQEEEAGQVGMVDRGISLRPKRRLGAIGDAEPGPADHADIVRAIADGERLRRVEAEPGGEFQQRFLLGFARRGWARPGGR